MSEDSSVPQLGELITLRRRYEVETVQHVLRKDWDHAAAAANKAEDADKFIVSEILQARRREAPQT